MPGSSGVAAVMALVPGLSGVATLAPLTPAEVFVSSTVPTTRPPGMGSQDWFCTETSSTCHHQPNELVKWNRNCTELCPPACGTCTVSRSGPRTLLLVWCHTVDQVCPPSVLTSTLPV